MGISRKSLKSIFEIIINNDGISRKALGEILGISNVAIGYAVEALISSSLIKSSKGTSEPNTKCRRTDQLISNEKHICLLINTCDGFISFSLSPLSKAPASSYSLPYIYTLNFSDNFAIALSSIKETLKELCIEPSFIAVAFPGDVCKATGRLINTRVRDYLGESLTDIMERYGMTPDMIISGAGAADIFCRKPGDIAKRIMYISIGEQIFGCINREHYENWGEISVDRSFSLSYSEALKCGCDEDSLTLYTTRFINTLRSAFAPDEIYVSSTVLSTDIFDQVDQVVHINSDPSPIISGLFEASKDGIFDKHVK